MGRVSLIEVEQLTLDETDAAPDTDCLRQAALTPLTNNNCIAGAQITGWHGCG
jgi:hypothetical protein